MSENDIDYCLSSGAISLVVLQRLFIGKWWLSHDVLDFCAETTNDSVHVSRRVPVLILFTPNNCNFEPSTPRKRWISTAACSAASAAAGLVLQTSHRKVGLDKTQKSSQQDFIPGCLNKIGLA